MSGSQLKNKHVEGFSLIEMMIALTVGLMILAALTAVIISSARSSRANDRTSELQNNGRYALDVLKRDLQHTGYHGVAESINIPAPLVINPDCAVGFSANFQQKIWGSDDANPFAATCIPAANYLQGDIFVIRYAGLNSQPATIKTATVAAAAPNAASFVPAGTANTLYFRASYNNADVTQGAAISTVTTGPAYDYMVQVHVYYIAPWSISAAENPQIPSLRRLVLNSTGTLVDELVASGIENMQVQYGVAESSSSGVLKTNPDGTPTGSAHFENASTVDGAVPSTQPSSNWNDVSSVRIWLLARNSGSERNETYLNTTDYSPASSPMGNLPSLVPNDQYRRQLYTTTVQVRN